MKRKKKATASTKAKQRTEKRCKYKEYGNKYARYEWYYISVLQALSRESPGTVSHSKIQKDLLIYISSISKDDASKIDSFAFKLIQFRAQLKSFRNIFFLIVLYTCIRFFGISLMIS